MSRIENNQTVVATALWAVSNIENSSRSDGPQGRGYNDGEQNKTAATQVKRGGCLL